MSRIGLQYVNRKRRMAAYAKRHNIARPKGFRPLTPTWGSAAGEMVRRIKARTWGPGKADKVWDARIARLVTPKVSTRQRALAIARAEIGVKEHPASSNDGPRVRTYQKVTGAYRQPWCASFTAWAYREAGQPLKGFNTAYVPSYVDSARARRNWLTVVSAMDARPGDFACFDWGRDGVADHIGIVNTPPGRGVTFTAVEGNTSLGNNSNGGQVMLRERTVSDVLVFVRVIEKG